MWQFYFTLPKHKVCQSYMIIFFYLPIAASFYILLNCIILWDSWPYTPLHQKRLAGQIRCRIKDMLTSNISPQNGSVFNSTLVIYCYTHPLATEENRSKNCPHSPNRHCCMQDPLNDSPCHWLSSLLHSTLSHHMAHYTNEPLFLECYRTHTVNKAESLLCKPYLKPRINQWFVFSHCIFIPDMQTLVYPLWLTMNMLLLNFYLQLSDKLSCYS